MDPRLRHNKHQCDYSSYIDIIDLDFTDTRKYPMDECERTGVRTYAIGDHLTDCRILSSSYSFSQPRNFLQSKVFVLVQGENRLYC